MIDTEEYYGGTYPSPDETKEEDSIEDYDDYIADIYYEDRELGLI